MDRENASHSGVAEGYHIVCLDQLLQWDLPDNGEPTRLHGREPSVGELRTLLRLFLLVCTAVPKD